VSHYLKHDLRESFEINESKAAYILIATFLQ
jgi:hypothetical protein